MIAEFNRCLLDPLLATKSFQRMINNFHPRKDWGYSDMEMQKINKSSDSIEKV